jgi:hypothetical protein
MNLTIVPQRSLIFPIEAEAFLLVLLLCLKG